jgi:hypothetical protein
MAGAFSMACPGHLRVLPRPLYIVIPAKAGIKGNRFVAARGSL